MSNRSRRELIVSFVDLSFFMRDAAKRDDEATADALDAYYERIAARVEPAGGTVVKVMGDGALFVFPPERADAAADALFALRDDVDTWLARERWESRLVVKAHAGEVIAGDYGAGASKRFDVIGNVVNITARLPRPFHFSPQMFRLLSADARRRFKKHTPPITYIPVDDKH